MAYTDKTVTMLTTEVRTLLNELVPMMVSDSDIGAGLDFATNEMFDAGLIGQDSIDSQYATPTPVSYIAYTTEERFYPEAVVYVGASHTAPGATSSPVQAPLALRRTHVKQMNHNQSNPGATSTYPTEWYFLKDLIYLWPPPGTALAEHYVKVFGYLRLDAYDETAIPPYLQEYTIWYALSRALQKIGNHAAAQQYMSIFNNFISFHRQEIISDRIDAYDDMKSKDRTQAIQ